MTELVDFTLRALIDGTDVSGITLVGASISYGTTETGKTPEPSSAYLELISADVAGDLSATFPEFTFGNAIPSGFVDTFAANYGGATTKLSMGAPVSIVASTPTGFEDTFSATYDAGYDSIRFTGYITALDVTPSIVTVTAVSPIEALTRILVDPSGWPSESDIDRVARIATAAGLTIRVEGTATHTVLPFDVDEKETSVWSLLDKVATDAGALFYANRLGEMIYRTVNATVGKSLVTLAAGATLIDDLTMTQEIGRVVNSLEVSYGDPKATVTVTDAASIAAYGERTGRLSVNVASTTDAQAAADRYLERRSEPVWHMRAATVNLKLAKTASPGYPANVTAILDVDLDDDVTLPQLLPASPMHEYTSRVVGYDETLDPYQWSITYRMNPAGLTERNSP